MAYQYYFRLINITFGPYLEGRGSLKHPCLLAPRLSLLQDWSCVQVLLACCQQQLPEASLPYPMSAPVTLPPKVPEPKLSHPPHSGPPASADPRPDSHPTHPNHANHTNTTTTPNTPTARITTELEKFFGQLTLVGGSAKVWCPACAWHCLGKSLAQPPLRHQPLL